jgi:hypothetical protein
MLRSRGDNGDGATARRLPLLTAISPVRLPGEVEGGDIARLTWSCAGCIWRQVLASICLGERLHYLWRRTVVGQATNMFDCSDVAHVRRVLS